MAEYLSHTSPGAIGNAGEKQFSELMNHASPFSNLMNKSGSEGRPGELYLFNCFVQVVTLGKVITQGWYFRSSAA